MADPGLVLNQLNLVARDLDATLAFYRRLGLEIPERPSPGEIRHAEATLANGFVLEFDNLALARTYNAAWRGPAGSSRALLGFSVATREAVDERYADLIAAGYAGRQPPYDTFWGARYAVVADPDDNDVGIMSPQDESRRRIHRRPRSSVQRRRMGRVDRLHPAPMPVSVHSRVSRARSRSLPGGITAFSGFAVYDPA